MIKNPQAPYGASLGRLENKLHQTFGKTAVPFDVHGVKPSETMSGMSPKSTDVVKPRNPLVTTMRGIKNG
jgi:hypothetical protein